MQTEQLVLAAALAVLLSLAAGCTQSGEETALSPADNGVLMDQSVSGEAVAEAGQPGEPETRKDNELKIPLPRQLQFPGLASVQAAPSWSARIADFSANDQAYLADVSERYFGSLEFQSEEEQRHLIQQGFPMPEEWLAAGNLLDTELERLAKDGNLKSQMFWIDRVGQKIGPIRAAGDGLGDSPADRELFTRFAEAKNISKDLLRESKSPFAAYLNGRLYSAGYHGNPPATVAGSFQLAKDLGDGRADDYMERFSQENPGMDAASVMSSYARMKAATER